jgi:hypothetical protein
MTEITEFVDVVPSTSIGTLLAIVRGQTVTAKQATLAGANILLYGAGLVVGPAPMGRSSPLEITECESTLLSLQAAAGGSEGMQRLDPAKVLSLIQTLLPLILRLL